MPVSETSKATTVGDCFKVGWSSFQPEVAWETLSFTPPCSVNLKALESRFFSTCCRRLESVTMVWVRSGSIATSKDSRRLSASWRKGRATAPTRAVKTTSSASMLTVPDSIFDRSRMSLISFCRSVPAP